MQTQPDFTSTSLKISETLYKNFKVFSIENELTFQKFVNRALHYYINSQEFRGIMSEEIDISGSKI